MKKKEWFEIINFYSLFGIVFIWVASWLFLIPYKANVDVPIFDNIWGMFLSLFGIFQKKTTGLQQYPDLLSGIISLIIIIFLQIRGIFSVTSVVDVSCNEKDENKFLSIFLSILSILIYTFFFSVIIKIFLFPNLGFSTTPFFEKLKINFGITIFSVFCIGGIIFGVPSVSKLLFILLIFVSIFKNIKTVSKFMGITGFVAIVFAIIGVCLNLFSGEINKEKLGIDMNILLGRYSSLVYESNEETKEISRTLKKNIFKRLK